MLFNASFYCCVLDWYQQWHLVVEQENLNKNIFLSFAFREKSNFTFLLLFFFLMHSPHIWGILGWWEEISALNMCGKHKDNKNGSCEAVKRVRGSVCRFWHCALISTTMLRFCEILHAEIKQKQSASLNLTITTHHIQTSINHVSNLFLLSLYNTQKLVLHFFESKVYNWKECSIFLSLYSII